jgi:hypothetical protein
MAGAVTDHKPKPKYFREKIGRQEYQLEEMKLDVFDEVNLWADNPRLQDLVPAGKYPSEEDLEDYLRTSPGYDGLARSIADLGQMEPIYVWRRDGADKYLALEGSTRVTILRELARKKQGQPDEQRFRRVLALALPEEFSEEERVVLLARIHVRGSGVRAWGRYIEARFIYNNVVDSAARKALMSVSQLAEYMGKSVSWVSRLKDAYDFAKRFVEHIDDQDEAQRLAKQYFSTLEEIAKSTGFGARVRDYGNPDSDSLRAEVFEMVRNDVFKEYRDARFMKQFFEDPEKWELLRSGERHVANRLANDLKAGNVGVKGRISGLPAQVERALVESPDGFDENDVNALRLALRSVEARVNMGVSPFRLHLRQFTKALEDASLSDIKQVIPDEMQDLEQALTYFREQLARYNKRSATE